MLTQNPGLVFAGLLIFSLGAVLFVLCTSFLKYSIVLNVLRSSIGLQQAPPTIVISAMAVMMTFQTMYPVFEAVYEIAAADTELRALQSLGLRDAVRVVVKVATPIRSFMARNIPGSLFRRFVLDGKLSPETVISSIGFSDLTMLFVVSEITSALKISIVLYMVFLLVDLTIAAALQVIGMSQLQLSGIATPIKFLLVCSSDGIYRIIRAVSAGYLA